LAQQTGDRRYESDALAVLGSVHHHRGRGGEAADACRRALALARDIHGPQAEAHALTGLAAACLYNGEVDRAGELAGEALVIARRGGYRLDQARAHLVAGAALRRLHRYAGADTHRDRARELFAAVGAPLAEHARAVFGQLTEPV
jgi:tetratricopeptide (TPR) repeat protein